MICPGYFFNVEPVHGGSFIFSFFFFFVVDHGTFLRYRRNDLKLFVLQIQKRGTKIGAGGVSILLKRTLSRALRDWPRSHVSPAFQSAVAPPPYPPVAIVNGPTCGGWLCCKARRQVFMSDFKEGHVKWNWAMAPYRRSRETLFTRRTTRWTIKGRRRDPQTRF